MKSTFQRSKTTTIVTGVASLACGLVVFSNPTGAALLLTRLIGGVLAAIGAVSLIGYVRRSSPATQIGLFAGLAGLVFGMMLVAWPAVFVSWIIVIIGAFILLSGVGDFMEARAWSAAGVPSAPMATVLAGLTIAFGVLVVVSPFALVDLTFTIAGLGLVFNGVTELVAALKA